MIHTSRHMLLPQQPEHHGRNKDNQQQGHHTVHTSRSHYAYHNTHRTQNAKNHQEIAQNQQAQFQRQVPKLPSQVPDIMIQAPKSSSHQAQAKSHQAQSKSNRAQSHSHQAKSQSHQAQSQIHQAQSQSQVLKSPSQMPKSPNQVAKSLSNQAQPNSHQAQAKSHQAQSKSHQTQSKSHQTQSKSHQAQSHSHETHGGRYIKNPPSASAGKLELHPSKKQSSNMVSSPVPVHKAVKQEKTPPKTSVTAALLASVNSFIAPGNPNSAFQVPNKKGNKGYGGADPLWGYFSSVAGADQQIDAIELQRCLTQSGIAGNYQMFSLETCRIMISMLDRDYSGKMGFNEFKELWTCLNQWRTTFYQYDADRSGTVEPHELQNAIRSWGYNLTPQALNIIVKRYSTDSRVTFDNFMAIAVRLRLLTDSFRRRDSSQTGHAQFGYDDFIQMTMYC